MSSSTQSPGAVPLFALAIGAFGIGVTEFSPMGLLPETRTASTSRCPRPALWSPPMARILTSLAHGAFFAIGAVLAASLVPADRQASALAAMFMGLTIANVGGLPTAT